MLLSNFYSLKSSVKVNHIVAVAAVVSSWFLFHIGLPVEPRKEKCWLLRWEVMRGLMIKMTTKHNQIFNQYSHVYDIKYNWMKASTWECNCLEFDPQRWSESSVSHLESCVGCAQHHLGDFCEPPNSSLLSWRLSKGKGRHLLKKVVYFRALPNLA